MRKRDAAIQSRLPLHTRMISPSLRVSSDARGSGLPGKVLSFSGARYMNT